MFVSSDAFLSRSCVWRISKLMLFSFCLTTLVVNALGQSRFQDVANFHPYCIRLFRSCVESSHSGGAGTDYGVAVGICGNKMAICTFSNSLKWPWSTGQDRPASPSVDATPRLVTYRKVLTTPTTATLPAWQNISDFLSDCRAEFRRCVDSVYIGTASDQVVGVCGHGMSICTERQGKWPYGNDTSEFWLQPYTNVRLQVYRNAYSSGVGTARNWQALAVFLPSCRTLLTQCVPTSGGASSDITIRNCGNQMGLCTAENVFWPNTDDATTAYTEPYDARWQRYANLISPTSRWQNIKRFSIFCIDHFFQCAFASGGQPSDAAIGVCGNRMSLCTFNQNVWPLINSTFTPFETEPYTTRMEIYRQMFETLNPLSTNYSVFPEFTGNASLQDITAINATNAGAFSYITLSGAPRSLLKYMQSFGITGSTQISGGGAWLTSHSGEIPYTESPITNDSYFTGHGRVRVIDGDGYFYSGNWAVFNFGPARITNYEAAATLHPFFGGMYLSGGTGGLNVSVGRIWGYNSFSGWTLLYQLSLPGDFHHDHWRGNWFNSGGTVVNGNGKRTEYDSTPLTHIGFSVGAV